MQDKLPQHLRGPVGTKMRAAYHDDSALLPEAQLQALARELDKTHPWVSASLREGAEAWQQMTRADALWPRR